ncbi:PAS domain-containing sensor histidine kinase [Polynucleobacter paneuropaeus]|uniref:PAS domain-containing sensor histidine kinase n=1 Tax=Polynucleobacter paneuropaeus TaxID=2527775 RepID=UPI001BFE7A7D|nr:PAS domain S-box protein [Polynucleobacter paneuropaeus]MBT8634961.1 PAS domain S-box protein [Polynucleobacter paneuropaeus]QWD51655.1 PAS domain S-box protein [Polynucleobacter paneuropaeus]QWD54869.1 PAS domain S-box protein [Polynucleobacter paneuropaeus]QWD56576.1 PAS domain S-box protein [Polynucleobacter paneuropaeus]
MKKQARVSQWVLGPLRWIRKIRGFRIVYTPLLAIVIFTAVMGIILGTLQLQEKNQQEAALFRELVFAKQRIQLRFSNNTDSLLIMSRDIASSGDDGKVRSNVLQQAEALLGNAHEISKLLWINKNNEVQWVAQANRNKRDLILSDINGSDQGNRIKEALRKTINISHATGQPAYSQFIVLNDPEGEKASSDTKVVFWQVIPIFGGNENLGEIAVLYTAQGILDMIPAELKAQYRFTLVTDNERILAISSDRTTPKRSFSNQTSLDIGVLSPNLTLRIDTYPAPTNLTFQMLVGVVLGLSAFVIWSLWSVLKQMQVRQEAEANLKLETNFRNAMEDSTPVGIRGHDMDGRITYVNKAFCEMTGWQEKNLIGLKPPFPFWPDDKKTAQEEQMNLALDPQNHDAMRSGIRGIIVRHDGTPIDTRTFIAPLVNEKGIQTGWVTSVIDITDSTKAREELAASQERFITVLEGLDAAVSVVSIETGALLFANRFYRERFGNDSKGHFDLVGGEMAHHAMQELTEESGDRNPGIPPSALYQESESEEIQPSDESGKWYEVRRRFIPWIDEHMAQLLIATDITVRKEADELSRQQEEKMQFTSRLTTMGEMASSLAHELNQPLSAISNYCMGVVKRLQGAGDSDMSREILPALEKASEQAIRAGTIIQRIRGFVKRSEPQREMTSITEIINDAVGLLEIEANRHRLSIVSSIAENLPEVPVDPVLILQVLVNLLKNALDSVREAYPSSSRWSAPPVKIAADLDTSTFPAMLRIQVSDTGGGIAESVIDRMFEPFFSTKAEGMGMGLNICRSIIESHHGRLWAKNQMDPERTKLAGCAFTILLPLESEVNRETENERNSQTKPS